uniref:Uncharacterized protein n=1 Tax=Tanacetum cinerariifolium TaxID=118510 RepID=A0A6L2M6P1_TANCI|nr:hypothetical protein [Tanacetum cinerariifolium]
MDEDMGLGEQAQLSNDEDIGSAQIPKTGDIATFIDLFCKRRGITELKPQDLEGHAFEIFKVFHLDVIHLQYQMEECHELLIDSLDDPILRNNVSKPLPLGGPPGQVTIQSDFFFNKDLEYLRYSSKAQSGHTCGSSVLRLMDLNDHVIVERDFKYLYPSDFEDLYLLNLQEDFQLKIESYQTQLNLTKPQWDATGFEYKHDYTFIDSPRAVMFRDKYKVQMTMCFNEIHKLSDGTLQQIDKALDYMVKDIRINRMNPEALEDKEDLSQPRELCWWTTQKGRL